MKFSFLFIFPLLLHYPTSVRSKAVKSPSTEQRPLTGDFTLSYPKGKFEDPGFWKLNFSSEAPHYFASVHGLLQQWPNTFFPNGHVIVPGEIQSFTKLYHGWYRDALPESPEWLAFDIEMSYGIMGSTPNSFMFTYQTTRAVKVLYFDGESASLKGGGQMNSQMLHIFGNVTGPPDSNRSPISDEYMRAAGLCDWLFEKKLGGVGWGFEGIVRMNAGFELIWCNFSSPSLKLVSKLNVSAPTLVHPFWADHSNEEYPNALEYETKKTAVSPFPLLPTPTTTTVSRDPSNPPRRPDDWPRSEPFFTAGSWSWFISAMRHYGSSGLGTLIGENKVKLSPWSALSYYSPEFQSQGLARLQFEQTRLNLTQEGFWLGPSENNDDHRNMALKELMRRRRYHRLDKIDTRDAELMRKSSERILSDIVEGIQSQWTGADWQVITNDIVQTYASELMRLKLFLRSGNGIRDSDYTVVRSWMFALRAQSHTFLLPFLQYPTNLSDHKVWRSGSDLYNETIARCKYHHTRLLVPGEGISLGREEELLRWAVEETMNAICYVTQEIHFAVEDTWLTHFNDQANRSSQPWEPKKMLTDIRRWTDGVEELMAWLGWAGEWVRCEETCAWDEMCYIPMWPLSWQLRRHRTAEYRSTRGHGDIDQPASYFDPPEAGNTEAGYLFEWPEDIDDDLWEPKCVKPNYTQRI